MLRVLIVEDSPTVSLLIKSILDAEEDIKVVGMARDGEEGLRKTITLKPDIVTMDVHMPGMDGFESTRRIMEEAPRPIVIVTSSVDNNEVQLSFQALKAGALAVINKPSSPDSSQFAVDAEKLVSTVRIMAEVKVVSQLRRSQPKKVIKIKKENREKDFKIAAFAASTGGPATISTILKEIPQNFPVPFLIVQHITEGFDKGFAEWLSVATGKDVVLAQDNELLRNGVVYVAPHGKHMGVTKGGRAKLDDPSVYLSPFCPSANYLFDSIAAIYKEQSINVILTGMGNDGTEGLLAVHNAGGYIVAQDEESSVVSGMPVSATEAGVVDQVLPMEQIANAVSLLLRLEVRNEKKQSSHS